MNQIFKCRICGLKYNHNKMASNDDVGVCKWCAGDTGYDWNDEEEPEESTKAPRK